MSCPRDFPRVWTSFVHALIDVSQAEGPAGPRPPPEQARPPRVSLPAVPRLVAVGDLHGDLAKARRAFRLAGLIDDRDRWAGGTATVVQVGDVLDRGDQELQLLYWLERLAVQAGRAGGALHVLTGNHETMNVAGSYRYATPGGMASFARWARLHTLEAGLKAKCGCTGVGPPPPPPSEHTVARTAALQPGGAVTRRFLAGNPTVLQVGSTVFVHGGVLPQHVAYGLERINAETQEWMLSGSQRSKPRFLMGRSAIVWAREYSAEREERCDCETLEAALAGIPGARRMVVGHTIQQAGVNAACGGRVLRVDVGLSSGCGDMDPEVLEIRDDAHVSVLSEPGSARAVAKAANTTTDEAAAITTTAAEPRWRHRTAA